MIPRTNIDALRKKYASDNFIAFSIDVDWASEACIQKIVRYFRGCGIPLTVFNTHPSAFLDACRGDDQIELGIHPNFCGQSSQGDSMDEVIDYCMSVVPQARCVRGHRWFSSNDMYDRLIRRGILFDSNDSAMLDLAQPYIHRSGMLRIPVFFEDGGFLWNGAELNFQSQGRQYFDGSGLKVLDLHPIHFAINSPSEPYYRHIGDTLSRQAYTAMSEETIEQTAFTGYGMRDYLMELVDFIEKKRIQTVSLGSVYDDLIFYEGGPQQ